MRGPLIVSGICVVAIALGVFLFYFGPSSLQTDVQSSLQSAQDPTTNVSFTILEQGQDAISISDRTNYRITSEPDLEQLWTLVYGERDAPKIPNVDFSRYEVLAVFDGTHATTGYGISIAKITDYVPTRTITITHSVPDSTCQTTSEVTSPFEMVQVPITTYSIAHVDVTNTATCNSY